MTVELVPAAQYLRMSTDHQQYSLDNQADAIAVYAAEHSFRVVKTYSDAAKSGLRLRNRGGLKQLLRDVVERAPFRAVLVFDVSRWGRFQDADEAAHYEYLCKSAGVPVHYCAETFANDNSVPGSIMKALKRSMAGEYSRELSVKVRSGLERLTRMGYKAGGTPAYGLRRLLLEETGKPKQVLNFGQRKSLLTERVIVIPGPAHEVAVVKRIFNEFAVEQRSMASIAESLNRDRIRYFKGEWDAGAISRMIRHPHYVGSQVWGRTREYLRDKAERVPPDKWIICEGAFEPIISAELFTKARMTLAGLTRHLSDDEMLERLRTIWQAEGKLTGKIIERSPICPSLSTYYHRFGGILQAYKRVGYPHEQHVIADATRQRGWIVRERVMEELVRESAGQLDRFRPSRRRRGLLKCRRTGFLISVQLARYQPTRKTEMCWSVDPRFSECHRTTVLVLLDETNTGIGRLYAVRRLREKHRFVLREDGDFLKRGVFLEHPAKLLAALRAVRCRVD